MLRLTPALLAVGLLLLVTGPASAGTVRKVCLTASEAVGSANTKLTLARRATRQAKTEAATRRAEKRQRRAERAVSRAYKRRGKACANRPPRFPRPIKYSLSSETDPDTGDVRTYIAIKKPPRDADGDLVLLDWTATSGSIIWADRYGVGAFWDRDKTKDGRLKGGTITVKAYDGAAAKPTTFKFTIADGER
ncbi:MAG TPA: hypothetical protein VD790_04195 [Thermoleophilaceae bacterium]|nr:hypothetical protein [Thermoleophilaceae bacterium]